MTPFYVGDDPGRFMPIFFSGEEWRQAESPTGNMHASARALAQVEKIYIFKIIFFPL